MNANLSTTTHNWLVKATKQLKLAGIATAELDVLVLLEDCLGIPRANLLAHPETALSDTQASKLKRQIERRATHEPLAYIRGKSEFYGREFMVNQYTLEPRPETETMIEILKKLSLKNPNVADIGTGSGAIAITAKLELAHTKVIATDIDSNCLEVARQNAQKHSVDIEFLAGDLFAPVKNADVLLCNLPYVPDDFDVNRAAKFEPTIALFGGKDGLNLYRTLFEQVNARPQKPKLILTESLPAQHQELAKIAYQTGYKQVNSEDFIQVFEYKD